MDIKQKNTFGDNVVNINSGSEGRVLDDQAKEVIKGVLEEEKTDEVVITHVNDAEALEYADQAEKFIKDSGYAVSRRTALSRLKMPDGTMYGQGIFRDSDDAHKVGFLIGYLKKKGD